MESVRPKPAISLVDPSSDAFQILKIPWLHFPPCLSAKSDLQIDRENKHTLRKGMMSAQSLLLFIPGGQGAQHISQETTLVLLATVSQALQMLGPESAGLLTTSG